MAINPLQPPTNYVGMLPQVNLGQSFSDLGDAFAESNKQKEAEALKAQYSQDLQNTLSNPTPQAFAALTAKYPQQREAFKQSWEMMSEGQKNNEFLAGVQAYGAINSGNPEVAKTLLDERITAAKNSGQDASKLEVMRKAMDTSPNMVASQLGLVLSSVDPEKWSKMAVEMRAAQKAPAELTEAQAKAQQAATAAKFAESNAVMDLQKKGWDITKLQEDIQINKQNAKIAAMNASLAREGNDLKKQELRIKLQEAQNARDEKLNTKVADVESARSNIDNMLNTADRILKTPMGIVGAAAGPVSAKLPTLREDTADFEELVNTLASQSFLAQIPNIKGMGALSNAEGEKLQAALQNFSIRQSPERLLENVREAQRLLTKGRSTLAKRYGVPETIPDTPQATPQGTAGKSTDEMLRELGVMQ